MARTNKHDEHKDWILQRLQSNPNVHQLARDLQAEMGLRTTPREIRSWLKTLQRRQARSAAFAALIPDSAAPPGPLENLARTVQALTELVTSGQRPSLDVHVKEPNKSRKSRPAPEVESTQQVNPHRNQAPAGNPTSAPTSELTRPVVTRQEPAPKPETTTDQPTNVPPASAGARAINSKAAFLGNNTQSPENIEKVISQATPKTEKKFW